jgi:hypothetical protein
MGPLVSSPLALFALTWLSSSQSPGLASPTAWVGVTAPSGVQRVCANWSLDSWRVERRADGVVAMAHNDELRPRRDPLPFDFRCELETPARPARRVALRAEKHWLVACDLGNHGGGLWVLTDAGRPVERLSRERTWDVVRVLGRLFALTQDSDGRGLVLEVERDVAGYRVRRRASTAGYPIALVSWRDRLLLISRSGLYAVGGHGAGALIEYDLSALYPTSAIVGSSGAIYVAMRHYLLVLQPTGRGWQAQWMAPATCPTFEKTGEKCDCIR